MKLSLPRIIVYHVLVKQFGFWLRIRLCECYVAKIASNYLSHRWIECCIWKKFLASWMMCKMNEGKLWRTQINIMCVIALTKVPIIIITLYSNFCHLRIEQPCESQNPLYFINGCSDECEETRYREKE